MTQPTVDDLQKELNQLKIDIAKNKDKTVATKVVQSSQKLRKFLGTRERLRTGLLRQKGRLVYRGWKTDMLLVLSSHI